MSTYVQLCQRLRQEAGVAGTGPSTVASQTGMYQKLVNWVQRAWIDIQGSAPYWRFLRNQYTGTLTIGTRTYNVVTDLLLNYVDKWDPEGAWIYRTSDADISQIEWLTYPEFRRQFPGGWGTGRPQIVAEWQGDNLVFDKIPDYAYTIRFDYWMTPEKLTNDSDVPAAPEHYHDIIVWRALMMYAASEGAPELLQYARAMYSPMLIQLKLDQLDAPPARKSYPLAQGRSYRDNFAYTKTV